MMQCDPTFFARFKSKFLGVVHSGSQDPVTYWRELWFAAFLQSDGIPPPPRGALWTTFSVFDPET